MRWEISIFKVRMSDRLTFFHDAFLQDAIFIYVYKEDEKQKWGRWKKHKWKTWKPMNDEVASLFAFF